MLRLVFAAIVAADFAAIMIYPAEKPTFAARWSGVESINAGVKGDRLDKRLPAATPETIKGRNNWLANPHAGTRIACASFCEYP